MAPARQSSAAALTSFIPKQTQAFLQSNEMLRAALDDARTNLMVANADLEIVYVNPRSLETLKGIEAEIHKVFGVRVEDMMGGSIHRFHRDPAGLRPPLRRGHAVGH